MRLILKLQANRTVSQKEFSLKYYSAMNGFIYDKLSSNEELKQIHSKKNFKGFCFGNIYPIKDGKIYESAENGYNLVISSPIPKIIEHLFFNIKEGSLVNLGEGSFSVSGIEVRNFNVKKGSTLETLSIINLIKSKDGKPLLYKDGPEKYKEQLRINLIRKYNQLKNKKVSLDFDLFENVSVKPIKIKKNSKPYSVPLIFDDNTRFNAIGEKLLFKLNSVSDEQLAIFQVCFDAGFGERNAFGMGFMVVK